MSHDPFEKENRAFLHDLATPITFLRLQIKRLIKTADGKAPALSHEDYEMHLKKMLNSIEKMENLHADQKAKIHKRAT